MSTGCWRCWFTGTNAGHWDWKRADHLLKDGRGGTWGQGGGQCSFNFDSFLTHSRLRLRTELVRCLPTDVLQSLSWVKNSTDYIQSVRQDWLARQTPRLVWEMLLFEATCHARKVLNLLGVEFIWWENVILLYLFSLYVYFWRQLDKGRMSFDDLYIYIYYYYFFIIYFYLHYYLHYGCRF